jgi:hypothetical protein
MDFKETGSKTSLIKICSVDLSVLISTLILSFSFHLLFPQIYPFWKIFPLQFKINDTKKKKKNKIKLSPNTSIFYQIIFISKWFFI